MPETEMHDTDRDLQFLKKKCKKTKNHICLNNKDPKNFRKVGKRRQLWGDEDMRKLNKIDGQILVDRKKSVLNA